MNSTLFKWCRQFYSMYPQIGATVSHLFKLPEFEKNATISHEFVTSAELLLNNFSFSHIKLTGLEEVRKYEKNYYVNADCLPDT